MGSISFGFKQRNTDEWELDTALTVDSLARYVEWACGDDSGISSKTMLGAIIGVHIERYPGVPRDPSDFGRCYRMLQLFPELRPRIDEVPARLPSWSRFVERWPELERMYEEVLASKQRMAPELYEALKECGR